MVTAPAKKADDTKPVTPAKPSAPARVQVRAKALKGKKVKVSLKKTAEAKGYEIVYSTNVNFTKKTTKKISTKNLTKTIKKLKKKKTYYIKARAYKLDGKTKVWSIYLSEGCALDGDEVIYLIGEELGRGNRCIFQ